MESIRSVLDVMERSFLVTVIAMAVVALALWGAGADVATFAAVELAVFLLTPMLAWAARASRASRLVTVRARQEVLRRLESDDLSR